MSLNDFRGLKKRFAPGMLPGHWRFAGSAWHQYNFSLIMVSENVVSKTKP